MKKLTKITNVLFDKTSVAIRNATMSQLTGGKKQMKNYTGTRCEVSPEHPGGQKFDNWDD